MTPQEYANYLKEKYSGQSTKDGQLIRDMNDFELIDRTLKRYPGDRDMIDPYDLEEYYNTYDPSRKPPPPPPKTGVAKRIDELTGGLTQALKTRQQAAHTAMDRGNSGEYNPLSVTTQVLGNAAGLAGDAAFEGIKAITPDFIREPLGNAVEAVGSTEPVQDAMGAYEAWKAENPEAAGNLESVINIAGILPAAKGAQLAGRGVGKGAEVVADAAVVAGKSAPGVANKALGAVGDAAKGAVALPGKASSAVLKKVAPKAAASMDASKLARADEDLMNLIMEKSNKRSTVDAFNRAGKEGGITAEGGARRFVRTPDARDISMRESVRGVVDPKKDAVQNNIALNDAIETVSEKELLPFLRANPRTFNPSHISKRLDSIEMPDLFKADQTLENTYNLVRQRMLKAIQGKPKTMEGLWEARKDFDRMVKDQFGDAAFDSEKNTAIKRAVQDMRREVNTFIGDSIGDKTFAQQMHKLSDMYGARDNIAEKARELLGSDKYNRWFKKLDPRTQSILLWGGGLIGTGFALNTAFGDKAMASD